MIGDRFSRAASAFGAVLGAAFLMAAASAQTSSSGDAEDGAAAFARICAGCHGAEGAGGVGPRLVPFTRTERELLAIVREGNGQMPALSRVDISDEEVAAVAEYLRKLGATP